MTIEHTKSTAFECEEPAEALENAKVTRLADIESERAPFSIESSWIYRILPIFVFILAVVALSDWQSPEFGRHPDEAAHFITGTLVHDWVSTGFSSSSVDYGLHYYTRFPKVALGHWPPVFYGIQGVWYGLFGVSRWSATALTSTIAVVFLTLLTGVVRRSVSTPSALLALALVISSPVFRYVSTVFMADTLVAVLSLSAIWCFAIYLERGGLKPILGFGVLSGLAILTKQDAIVLAVVPPLSVIARRRWDLLKDWRFYVPALVVLAICAPYYWFVKGLTHSPWEGMARRPWEQKAEFLLGGLSLCGPIGWAISLFGFGAAVLAARKSTWSANILAVLTAHVLGVAAVQMATPVSFDPRYKTALIPISAFFAANAFNAVLQWRYGAPALKLAGLTLLTVALIVAQPMNAFRKVTGYRQAVESLSERTGLQVVMVCSDPQGDGAVTAEFRLQHPDGKFVLVRADKMLAASTWMNQNYRLIYETPEDVEKYLLRQPVHYVLIDDWGKESGTHHALLEATLKARPDRFPLVSEFKIERLIMGFTHTGTAKLYRVEGNAGQYPSEVELTVSGLPRDGKIKASVGDF